MGEVYLAEDARLHRKVAFKVLPQTFASDIERLRRFEQEAFAASALNHPNILTVYEFGFENNTHFLATELIEGETLREKIGELSLDDALHIGEQITLVRRGADILLFSVTSGGMMKSSPKLNALENSILCQSAQAHRSPLVFFMRDGLTKQLKPREKRSNCPNYGDTICSAILTRAKECLTKPPQVVKRQSKSAIRVRAFRFISARQPPEPENAKKRRRFSNSWKQERNTFRPAN